MCILFFGLVYFASAELGHALSLPGPFASIWPPSGLYIAGLLLSEQRRWPLLVAAALVANAASGVLLHGQWLPISLGFWLSGTAEALAGTFLIRRFSGLSVTISSLRNVLAITVFSALFSAALGSTLATSVITVTSKEVLWVPVWQTWWLADALGMLIVAPLVLVVATDKQILLRMASVRRSRLFEVITLGSTFVAAAQLLFGSDEPYHRAFLLLPFRLWATLRFEIPGTIIANFVLAMIIVINTLRGDGPFAAFPVIAERTLIMQAFLYLSSVFFLVLAALLRERRQAAKIVQDREQRLRLAMEVSATGLLDWNINTGVMTWSPECYLIFGLRKEEFDGTAAGLDRLLQQEDRSRVWAAVHTAIEQRTKYECEFRIIRPDGNFRWVVNLGRAVYDKQGQAQQIIGTLTDITESKRAEDRMRLLGEVAGVLLSTDDLDAMLHSLLARIGPTLSVDAYFNYMVEDTGDTLRLMSYAGISQETASSITRLEFGQDLCGTVALRRQPLVIPYLQQVDHPKAQWARAAGLRVYTAYPLLSGDLLLGTLAFSSRSVDQFDSEELAILQAITQYVIVFCERLRLLHKVQETARRKDEFLATLAHELRNPLVPVRNAVQLLNMKAPSIKELRWATDVIDRQVQQMARLIDDLMDVSRINSNKLELRKERIELTRVIEGALDTSRPLIQQRGHELIVTLPPELIILDADLTRLAQVFLNLLNNAAKYMDSGGRIDLHAEQQGNEVVVSVKDTGIGIAADQLPSLFELFSQVEGSLSRSQGGLGIGLALVKQMVEMHGGSITVFSEGLGKGSEFVARLPIVIEQQNTPYTSADNKAMPSSKLRVLVVDDNFDAASSMAMLVEMMGNDVRMAHDGEKAVAAAKEFRPHAMLLDIGLPKMNGYDVARTIRQESWGKSIFLIAVTGWGQEDDKRKSREAGFDLHMIKPVDPLALMELLASLPST
ncbi:MAG: MASE1 domain-containing protein [Methylobacter sp.]|nr:MASE1 domain-containing protein [Methylobacter sp.]